MKVSDVSREDGEVCANLINFLNAAKWDISGKDIDALMQVKKWVHDVAVLMATDLKPKTSETPSQDSFKLKAMGPLGSMKKAKK